MSHNVNIIKDDVKFNKDNGLDGGLTYPDTNILNKDFKYDSDKVAGGAVWEEKNLSINLFFYFYNIFIEMLEFMVEKKVIAESESDI